MECFIVNCFLLQFGLFTTVHKHYTVEDWTKFCSENPDVVKVCMLISSWQYQYILTGGICLAYIPQSFFWVGEDGQSMELRK